MGIKSDRGQTVNILGVKVHNLNLPELFSIILVGIGEIKKTLVLGANIKSLNLAFEQDWFKIFYNRSDALVFCDGVGVQLGAKVLEEELSERVTPPDWFPDLCQFCAQNDLSMFLLGTNPGITERVADIYMPKYPGLNICGTYHGYFDKAYGSEENNKVVKLINETSPDILLVGFGMPLQEKWLKENLEELNSKIFIAVGAMFDFLAGETFRGPKWLTDHGFEWFTRLLTEPRRLWKRYLIGIPLFFIRIISQKLKAKDV